MGRLGEIPNRPLSVHRESWRRQGMVCTQPLCGRFSLPVVSLCCTTELRIGSITFCAVKATCKLDAR